MISSRAKRAGLKELEVFDNFMTDHDLPKHENPMVDNEGGSTISFQTSTNVGNGMWIGTTPDQPMSNESWGEVEGNEKPGFWKRLGRYITFQPPVAKNRNRTKQLITIRDFFLKFAENTKELTPLADIAEHYEQAILQAEKLGQKTLKEKLTDQLEVVRAEAHLIQMGLTSYVTEEQVYDFFESVGSDKNLKLTWIKNFVKVIPSDIVNLKESIDTRKIFDNYVILHYDPHGNATDLTKMEKEVKKDPILFGVMKNSKRLYYVGDWKDDYCDLTLEGMFEELGEKVLTINNRNLKTYISKGGDYEQKRKLVK